MAKSKPIRSAKKLRRALRDAVGAIEELSRTTRGVNFGPDHARLAVLEDGVTVPWSELKRTCWLGDLEDWKAVAGVSDKQLMDEARHERQMQLLRSALVESASTGVHLLGERMVTLCGVRLDADGNLMNAAEGEAERMNPIELKPVSCARCIEKLDWLREVGIDCAWAEQHEARLVRFQELVCGLLVESARTGVHVNIGDMSTLCGRKFDADGKQIDTPFWKDELVPVKDKPVSCTSCIDKLDAVARAGIDRQRCGTA